MSVQLGKVSVCLNIVVSIKKLEIKDRYKFNCNNFWISIFLTWLSPYYNQYSHLSQIGNARQKETRSGTHVNHGYSNEFLDYDRTVNVHCTRDVDATTELEV